MMQTNITHPCDSVINPCGDHGTCVKAITEEDPRGHTCNCAPGYVGMNITLVSLPYPYLFPIVCCCEPACALFLYKEYCVQKYIIAPFFFGFNSILFYSSLVLFLYITGDKCNGVSCDNTGTCFSFANAAYTSKNLEFGFKMAPKGRDYLVTLEFDQPAHYSLTLERKTLDNVNTAVASIDTFGSPHQKSDRLEWVLDKDYVNPIDTVYHYVIRFVGYSQQGSAFGYNIMVCAHNIFKGNNCVKKSRRELAVTMYLHNYISHTEKP